MGEMAVARTGLDGSWALGNVVKIQEFTTLRGPKNYVKASSIVLKIPIECAGDAGWHAGVAIISAPVVLLKSGARLIGLDGWLPSGYYWRTVAWHLVRTLAYLATAAVTTIALPFALVAPHYVVPWIFDLFKLRNAWEPITQEPPEAVVESPEPEGKPLAPLVIRKTLMDQVRPYAKEVARRAVEFSRSSLERVASYRSALVEWNRAFTKQYPQEMHNAKRVLGVAGGLVTIVAIQATWNFFVPVVDSNKPRDNEESPQPQTTTSTSTSTPSPFPSPIISASKSEPSRTLAPTLTPLAPETPISTANPLPEVSRVKKIAAGCIKPCCPLSAVGELKHQVCQAELVDWTSYNVTHVPVALASPTPVPTISPTPTPTPTFSSTISMTSSPSVSPFATADETNMLVILNDTSNDTAVATPEVSLVELTINKQAINVIHVTTVVVSVVALLVFGCIGLCCVQGRRKKAKVLGALTHQKEAEEAFKTRVCQGLQKGQNELLAVIAAIKKGATNDADAKAWDEEVEKVLANEGDRLVFQGVLKGVGLKLALLTQQGFAPTLQWLRDLNAVEKPIALRNVQATASKHISALKTAIQTAK